MDIQVLIRKLVSYGVQTGLVPEEDVIYTTNRLLELFELDELEERDNVTMREDELEEVLKGMLDYAYEKGGRVFQNNLSNNRYFICCY